MKIYSISSSFFKIVRPSQQNGYMFRLLHGLFITIKVWLEISLVHQEKKEKSGFMQVRVCDLYTFYQVRQLRLGE